MTTEEAIKTAIAFEAKVRDVYQSAVEGATNPVAKRIFRLLSYEEQKHLKFLQRKLDVWTKTGKITAEKLKTTIPSKEAISEGINKLRVRMSDEDRGSEIQMLTKALDAEIKTSTFYKKMVSELPPDGQRLFTRFVEIKDGHLAIVQAEIDYLSKTGHWFDFREFDMEGG